MSLKNCGACVAASISIIVLLTIKNGWAYASGGTHRTYYVNNKGSDAGAGTISKPFKSINKVNALRLKAGDTVCFRSGQTFNGTLLLTQGITGTSKHPVVISTYGTGNAIINAKDSTAIKVYKAAYLKLQHLTLMGSGRKTGNIKDGLAIINSTNVKVTDLDISGFQKSGLLIYSSQNIIAAKIFSHDNGSAGITVEAPYQTRESHNIVISGCRAENNPGDPTNLTNHSGNGIVVGDCRAVLIDHCTATNNGWDMPRIGNGPVGIWAYEADSITIQHCLSYKNKTSKGGADGGGFDLDGGVTNSIVQYNLSYGNWGSGYCIFQYWGASPWHDNIFRYNISENDGTVSDSQAGLYVWNSSDDEKQFHDCEVYGNIIYNSKVAAICYSEKSESKGIRLYDNIFIGRDSLIRGIDKIGDVKYLGNDWWSIQSGFNIDGIKNIKEWAAKTGKEQKDGKMIGLNLKPDFAGAGKTTITSASQLKSLANYKLSKKSALRNRSIYTDRYGISKLKL
ncbi:MAG: right-handed parallel beta-helix repeat-containing protein [Mucilaginibacter sp.]